MLILVQPDLKLKSINLSMSAVQLVELAGADVGSLSWEGVFEKYLIADMVRLALRHGHTCSRGLVVDAVYASALQRPTELRSSLAAAQRVYAGCAESKVVLARTALGRTEQRRQVDERVHHLTNESIKRADRKRADLLAAAVKGQLLEHWKRLSSYLPNPL